MLNTKGKVTCLPKELVKYSSSIVPIITVDMKRPPDNWRRGISRTLRTKSKSSLREDFESFYWLTRNWRTSLFRMDNSRTSILLRSLTSPSKLS